MRRIDRIRADSLGSGSNRRGACSRSVSFSERSVIQRRALDLPALPTTTIGSFPQTEEIRKLRKGFRDGSISREEYNSRIHEKIEDIIRLQENIDLDVLVHGEFERNDMVEYFGENLEGFLHTENGWVQSYGTRCVKPPVIFGDIRRPAPITVDWIVYAQGLTNRPVKGMLTGPVTILNWSFPRAKIRVLPKRHIRYHLPSEKRSWIWSARAYESYRSTRPLSARSCRSGTESVMHTSTGL